MILDPVSRRQKARSEGLVRLAVNYKKFQQPEQSNLEHVSLANRK
jgi:hypothetical protein